ncbi:MAG: hypothetical protein APF76_10430 [Desulfitibacter sp. BRH_c19]|nr:MAG: hypothetical protein APF76_10430 [Desulfitibacter sp. BRH_c19]
MKVFKELFFKMDRQVPGSKDYTLKAAEIAGLKSLPAKSKVLDAGCATGNATIILTEEYPVEVVAVDADSNSLKILEERAADLNLRDKISLYNTSMLNLNFENEFFDVIWSEGSIHNVGFFKGLSYLKKFLKPGGKIVVSELTWIKDSPPDEVFWYWKENYPDMTGIKENVKSMEKAGLKNIGHFEMGKDGFWDNYYKPMYKHINYFQQKFVKNSTAQEQLEELQTEIDYFVKFGDYYSYVFFIGEK